MSARSIRRLGPLLAAAPGDVRDVPTVTNAALGRPRSAAPAYATFDPTPFPRPFDRAVR